MNEWVGRGLLGTFVNDGAAGLDAEFENRLRDSSGLAFGVAYGVLRNREDAEEVAQDAFARAFRRFHQLRDRDAFRSWLTRMTWRLAIDRWRSDRRRAAREQAVAAEAPSAATADIVDERARSAAVWRAIDRLADRLRIVVVLSAIEGHDTREVARLLNIPEGTVKSRMHLARKILAEQLQWMKR
jgi:RNA polymerase sigma-70 factor (ECF subfamily)